MVIYCLIMVSNMLKRKYAITCAATFHAHVRSCYRRGEIAFTWAFAGFLSVCSLYCTNVIFITTEFCACVCACKIEKLSLFYIIYMLMIYILIFRQMLFFLGRSKLSPLTLQTKKKPYSHPDKSNP